MTKESIMEYERKSIEKLKKFQLPNSAKKIGWILAGAAFIALFLTTKDTSYKMVAKYALLFGLFIVSISKEKIEDELVRNLRLQSYSVSFIFAVIISITNPLITYLVNFMFTDKQVVFDGVGDWMILWLLLSVQVLYFEILKRSYAQ